jgi:hypothetical protein
VRAAAQQVAGDMTNARLKAIQRNVNLGVLFLTQDTTHYWIHIEDCQRSSQTTTDCSPTGAKKGRQTINLTTPDTSQSTQRTLPPRIVFGTSSQCPSLPVTVVNPLFPTLGAFSPADAAFRFNALGAGCKPGSNSVTCPAVNVTGTSNLVWNDTAGNSTICLYDGETGLSRAVTVAPGGRIAAQ